MPTKKRCGMKCNVWLFLIGVLLPLFYATGQSGSPLELIQTIPMPEVQGRIDHMAFDLAHGRLFVAALGNSTLEVLDVRAAKVTQSLTGLKEPQGAVFVPETGKLLVATGGDGKCHAFSGNPLHQVSVLEIGDDADNVRYDAAAKRLYVGFGDGALGSFDAATLKPLGNIKLPGHPESFQLEKAGPRIFVNVPASRKVIVVDRVKQSIQSAWPMGNLEANFPMALIEPDRRILLVTRRPAKLVAMDADSGKIVAELDCAGDADDIFYDAKRKLVYVSCGEGVIDVFSVLDANHYKQIARVPTATGARTSLWVAELNYLLLAVPRREGREAAIKVYQAK